MPNRGAPPPPLLCRPPLPGGVGSGYGTLPCLPRLAEGLELLGPYRGSGCTETPYLLKRADGRMLEVSALLHLVVAALAGGDADESAEVLARRVTTGLGKSIGPDQLTWLVEHKLRPLGVLRGDGGTAPAPSPPRRAILGSTLRTAVVPARLVRAAAWTFQPLFLPPVVAAVLASLVAVDAVLVAGRGLGAGLHQVMAEPGLVLLASALMVVGGAFHELGHAAASRYGGAQPGALSAGIYLLWPAFSSNLNDSYRLSRGGRLRADLGGVYFNAVFVVVLAGLYGLTGFRPLLVVVLGQHLAIVQQFLPFLRLDGYYVVSDAIGVPDLFGRVRPILAALVPGRRPSPAVSGLRPAARVVVTAWVLLTVPLLLASLALLGLRLPAVLIGGWQSLVVHARAAAWATAAGRPVPALLGGLQAMVLLVPATGLCAALFRMLRRGLAGARSHWHRSPVPPCPPVAPRSPVPPCPPVAPRSPVPPCPPVAPLSPPASLLALPAGPVLLALPPGPGSQVRPRWPASDVSAGP